MDNLLTFRGHFEGILCEFPWAFWQISDTFLDLEGPTLSLSTERGKEEGCCFQGRGRGGAVIKGHRSGTLTPQGAGKEANSAKHIVLPMETSFYAQLAAVLAPCGVFLLATFLHRVVNNFFTPLRWECFWCNFAPNKSLFMVHNVPQLPSYL